MFVETADRGSFSACARELGKVQSAVSQGIANLELDFGIELFDRATRKPTLTTAGQRLLAYARVVLLQTDELNTVVSSILKEEETVIRLAIENSLPNVSLGKVLLDFKDKFPATEVEILNVASPDVIGLVESGRCDLGLMFSDMSFKRGVDLRFIGNLPLLPVCGSQHVLAELSSIEISHLAAHIQIVIRGESGGSLDYEAAISSMRWSSNSVHCSLQMIIQGVGWAYLPAHLVEEHIQAGRLYRLPMRLDDKLWSPSVDQVMQKGQARGPALEWLSEKLKNILD